MTEFELFEQQMREEDPFILKMWDRGDGTCLILKRLMFHWTLLVNIIGDHTSYVDRFCYETVAGGLLAAEEWIEKGLEEPTGWHRHHKSGRRRPGGDPSKEYIHD